MVAFVRVATYKSVALLPSSSSHPQTMAYMLYNIATLSVLISELDVWSSWNLSTRFGSRWHLRSTLYPPSSLLLGAFLDRSAPLPHAKWLCLRVYAFLLKYKVILDPMNPRIHLIQLHPVSEVWCGAQEWIVWHIFSVRPLKVVLRSQAITYAAWIQGRRRVTRIIHVGGHL